MCRADDAAGIRRRRLPARKVGLANISDIYYHTVSVVKRMIRANAFVPGRKALFLEENAIEVEKAILIFLE